MEIESIDKSLDQHPAKTVSNFDPVLSFGDTESQIGGKLDISMPQGQDDATSETVNDEYTVQQFMSPDVNRNDAKKKDHNDWLRQQKELNSMSHRMI